MTDELFKQLDKATEWLNNLSNLSPAVLTLLGCWAVGFALKKVPFVPNQYVPVGVFIVGPAGMLGLSDFVNSPLQFRAWVVRNLFAGTIISCAAWLSHRYLMKAGWAYLRARFPGAAKQIEAASQDTVPPFKPEQTLPTTPQPQTTETKGQDTMNKTLTALLLAGAVAAVCTEPVRAADHPTTDRYSQMNPEATGDGGGGGSTNLTFSGPAWELLSFLGTGSNWMVAPYGIASTDGKLFGGGIGVGYRVSDFVVPTMRLEGVYDTKAHSGSIWMPSASLQLQAPLTILGKVTVIPFTFAGIATPLSGKGSDNGSVVGIFGVGGALRIAEHWDLIGDFEEWTGFAAHQIRFGCVYKL